MIGGHRKISPRQAMGSALWRLSDLVRADERRASFRAKAYRRAVWSLDDLAPDLADPSGRILEVPGLGPGITRLIEEFRSEGSIAVLDRLQEIYPRDAARLRRLPRMTPALLRSLKGELGVDHASELIAAVESGGVETLRGVGSATAERWARTLGLAPSPIAVPAFQASEFADSFERHLAHHLGGRTWVAGSVRRMDEWVEVIDIVTEVEDASGAAQFLSGTATGLPRDNGEPGPVRLESHQGVELLVHLSAPGEAGPHLIEATGPPAHVAALLDGLDDFALTEPEIYARQNRLWIPPPARSLPDHMASAVVRSTAIRGDLHVHTDQSPDGRMTLADVVAESVERGYEYVLISDHTAGLRFGGLDEQDLIRQRKLIDETQDRFPNLVILHGAELNIDRDGGLDIDDDCLARLDLAVAGLHSHFDLGQAEQTARVVAALQHPAVRVLAHPTGRRVGIRPAVDLDFDSVVAAAIDNDVALEVNGHRDRLDLSAGLAAAAVATGAMLAANSDSHRTGEMGNVDNAVATIQKAGIGSISVVNTLPIDRFRDWVASGGGFT